MKKPNYLQECLALVLALQCCLSVALAQTKDKDKTSDRALEVSKQPNAAPLQGGQGDVSSTASEAPKLVIQLGHSRPVISVALSPDGRFAASGGKTLKLWEVATGKEIRTFNASQVNSVVFSPDGQHILAVDNTIKLWSVATGAEVRTFTGHAAGVLSVAFSPDGRYILSASLASRNVSFTLWDAATGTEIRTVTGHSGEVSSIAFSPDGRFALLGSNDGTIKLWEVATGTEVRTFTGHSALVLSVAFSPDGRYALSGSGRSQYVPGDKVDNNVKLWEVATGELLRTFTGHTFLADKNVDFGKVNSVAFSPNGLYAISASEDRTLKLWDIARDDNGNVSGGIGTFAGRWKTDRGELTIRLTGNRIAGAFQQGNGVITGLVTGSILDGEWTYAGGRVKIRLVLSPDGRAFTGQWTTKQKGLAGDLKGEYIGDEREVRTIKGHLNGVNCLAFSPDSHYLLSGGSDYLVKLWDATTGKEIRTFAGQSSPVNSVAFSPDGKYVVSGGEDQTLKLWDLTAGNEIKRLPGSSWIIRNVAFSPDGQYVATAGNGTEHSLPKLLEIATGTVVRTFTRHDGSVNCVAFSPDGRYILSGGYDQTLKLSEVGTGKEIRSILTGHENGISSIAFSPDGRYVVSASSGASNKPDNFLKLWDLATGKEIRAFTGKTKGILSAAFSPDGRYVLAGGWDKPLHLWEVATGEVRTLPEESEVHSVAFSPDGSLAISGGPDGTIKLWDVATGKKLKTFIGHSDLIRSVTFSLDGRFALSSSYDGTIKIWLIEDEKQGLGSDKGSLQNSGPTIGHELCTLVSFNDGHHAVIAPDGRFDTDNLDESFGLHWILPDDPFKPQPVEIFIREYYEPRLLTRILAREKFKPVKLLSQLNRVQPKVSITKIQSKEHAVAVTVEVSKAKGEFQRDGKKVVLETGAYDLRLFRDGQLVGYAPDSDGEIKLDSATGTAVKIFNVRLPRRTGVKQVEFSAYAFNVDRVKSATDRKVFEMPKDLKPAKGRAYLVTVGVNAYETADFDLNFAANDARRVQKIVFDQLAKSGEYEEIIQVPLISDYDMKDGKRIITEKTATKNNLKAVLDLLSGKKVAADLMNNIPNADNIRQARPEDLVLMSFSSHGFADDNGSFYFVPYDTGQGKEEKVTEDLMRRCISSEELSVWLRDVDAGEMVMIADACHSAATVDVDGFKPGPMGSRGLGQLAYDKGMRILTSTQADDVALESALIKQGLLTYALTHDGIEAGQADFKPKDKTITLTEWLEYGVSRVPALYEEVKRGELQSFGQGAEKRGLVHSAGKKNSDTSSASLAKRKGYQQPSLFDFSRKRNDVVLVR